jgi:hypothetical protein
MCVFTPMQASGNSFSINLQITGGSLDCGGSSSRQKCGQDARAPGFPAE